MSKTEIMMMLAGVALAFILTAIFMYIRNTFSRNAGPGRAKVPRTGADVDIRSKWIECHRCRGRAFGVFGTTDTYRCRSCGDKTRTAGSGVTA